MDIQENWEKALKFTEIIRPRIEPLAVFNATELAYIFLAESLVNKGDTIVRQGKILVEKPSIILPPNLPQFEGFDSEEMPDWNSLMTANFLFIRGVRFPSMKYNHKTESLDLYEGRLQEAIRHYHQDLQKKENVSTGLIIGSEDCWRFSVLIFIASQVMRQAEGDMKKLWDKFHREGGAF